MSTLREILELKSNGGTTGLKDEDIIRDWLLGEKRVYDYPHHYEGRRRLENYTVVELDDGVNMRYFKVNTYWCSDGHDAESCGFEYQKLEDIEEVSPRIVTTTIYE